MKRTTAPGSSAGAYVDYNPPTTTGTKLVAEDRNNIQEEICNLIEQSGATLDGGNQEQLVTAMIALSHAVGEPVYNLLERSPSWTFPAIRVDDADHDIDAANWPDLVTTLRSHKLKAGSTTDHSVTVAGSVVSFPSTTEADALLEALAEDVLVHGGYTAWLSLNIAGVDYAITDVNPGARTITVNGTPASGAQTGIVYGYRIAGSTTMARLRQVSRRALMSHDGSECIAGLRRRDRGQDHVHYIATQYAATLRYGSVEGEASATVGSYGSEGTSTKANKTSVVREDGAAGTPRIGTTTDPSMITGYLYIWGGRYISP